ncbi:MAG TPA: VWA domain-containing protein [Clostridia bacterium]|nr:VWA domain-containing protein [Clostridia bacterium]
MKMVSKILISSLAIVGLVTPSVAQEKTSDAAAKFRTQTNLVLVPVQVRSKGQHVAGLSKEKFTLLQDGKEQKIAVFEEIRTTTQRLRRIPVGPKEFTNQLQGSAETARYTVIAIDRINTGTMDMNRVHEGLMKFLSQAADNGEPIRLVAIELQGVRTIQDFTTDPKAVAAALQNSHAPSGQSLHGDADMGTSREMRTLVENVEVGNSDDVAARLQTFLQQIEDVENGQVAMLAFQQRSARINSLEALQQVALSLSGLPGRKSVVWVSSGYPFSSIGREGRPFDLGQVSEANSLDAYTTHLLNSANIALYPVDARGTVNTAFQAMDPSQKYSPSYAQKQHLQFENQDVITTFNRLAGSTGGKACTERTDLSGCFQDAMDDSRDYYMLGFYLDGANTKDGWHKLQAKVSEKGTSVRGRDGFLYPIPDPGQTRGRDITLAVSSLLSDSGIPFRGQWTTTQPSGDKRAARFEINVDPSANVIDIQQKKLNLEFAGIARARDGSVAAQFAQKVDRTMTPEAAATIQKTGINYKNVMVLAPGEYLVRFVVRDNNTGRMGTANSLVKVE